MKAKRAVGAGIVGGALVVFLVAAREKRLPNPWERAMGSFALSSPLAARVSSWDSAGYRLTEGMQLSSADSRADELHERLTRLRARRCFEGVRFLEPGARPDCYGLSPVNSRASLGLIPGEACLVAGVNAGVRQAGAALDGSMDFIAGLMCAAHAQGLPLPAAGQSADLTALVNASFADGQFSAVRIEALGEASGGAYRTTARGRVPYGLEGEPAAIDLQLTYAPSGAGEDGKGRLRVELHRPHVHGAYAVAYGRAGDRLSFELKQAESSRVGWHPFSGEGELTLRGGGWDRGCTYARLELSRRTGLGTVHLAWQAAPGQGRSQVLQATSAEGREGDSGVGHFGPGPDLARSLVMADGFLSGDWQTQSFRRARGGFFVPVTPDRDMASLRELPEMDAPVF